MQLPGAVIDICNQPPDWVYFCRWWLLRQVSERIVLNVANFSQSFWLLPSPRIWLTLEDINVFENIIQLPSNPDVLQRGIYELGCSPSILYTGLHFISLLHWSQKI